MFSRLVFNVVGPMVVLSFLVFALFSCKARKEISLQGLSFVELGDEMPEKGRKKWKGKAVKDTLFKEEGYSWRAVVVEYKNGQVWIEEDFLGEHMVNRVRVETSDLTFRDSISVGKPVSILHSIPVPWFLLYLPAYDLWDISSEELPSLHFLVKPTNEHTTHLENPVLTDLNADSPILSIVIM